VEAESIAFALVAERGTGRYVGSAFINSSRAVRERLWERVQRHAGPAPQGMKRPAAQWVKPGLVGRATGNASALAIMPRLCKKPATLG